MVQTDWQHLGNTGMQVRSLTGHSGLRIWHYRSCSLGLDCGSDLIHSPGMDMDMLWGGQKREKKKGGRSCDVTGRKYAGETKEYLVRGGVFMARVTCPLPKD